MNPNIEITQGDVTTLDVDAIVSAAAGLSARRLPERVVFCCFGEGDFLTYGEIRTRLEL